MSIGLQRWQKRYVNLAVMFFNTAILFVLVNLVVGFGCNLTDRSAAPAPVRPQVAVTPASTHGRPRPGRFRTDWEMDHIDMDAFDGVAMTDVEGMLDDMTRFAALGVRYQPWVEYGPPLYQGRFVNVDGADSPSQETTGMEPLSLGLSGDRPDAEFPSRRSVATAPPPPSGQPTVEVYLFGGSTVFGWDTADRWTLGSYLWDALQRKFPHRRLHLVNYGRPLYFSSQEVMLFYRLLKTGHHPTVAVFMDGLNDVYQLSYVRDQPWFTPRLSWLLSRDQVGKTNDLETYQWIPIVKLAFYLRQRMSPKPPASTRVSMSEDPRPAEQVADYVLQMYRRNRTFAQQVASAAAVPCYFFWQPCPFFAYDVSLHRVPPDMSARNQAVYSRVYEAMQHDPGTTDLGSLAQSYGHRKVYVDDVHYSPAFARYIADRMAAFIQLPQP